MMITPNTTVAQIREDERFRGLFRYFAYDGSEAGSDTLADGNATLLDLQNRYVTWNASEMALGLNALASADTRGPGIPVYGDAQIREDPEKADVKLFFFKADERARRHKTCVIAPGGAYLTVYAILEGFPIAAALAALGVDVFCLNYRVGTPSDTPLFPSPMEDMACAVRYLIQNADALGINMNDYAVGGFSAGGHLAACFGLKSVGYARYGLPRPNALILNYPLTDVWGNVDLFPEPARTVVLQTCLGQNCSPADAGAYNVTALADGDYPPCFIAQTEDDPTVPVRFTDAFADKLTSLGVPVEFFRAKSGPHGYGLGTACDAAGWDSRAVAFWDGLTGK